MRLYCLLRGRPKLPSLVDVLCRSRPVVPVPQRGSLQVLCGAASRAPDCRAPVCQKVVVKEPALKFRTVAIFRTTLLSHSRKALAPRCCCGSLQASSGAFRCGPLAVLCGAASRAPDTRAPDTRNHQPPAGGPPSRLPTVVGPMQFPTLVGAIQSMRLGPLCNSQRGSMQMGVHAGVGP